MMKNSLFIILLTFLLSSCATFLNKKNKTIQIATTTPGYIVIKGDTIPCFNEKTLGIVERSNKTLTIKAFNDSVSKTVNIKARKSSAYWMNIANLGAGFFIDAKSQKRYTYPSHISINIEDDNDKYLTFDSRSKKGIFEFSLSLLPFNSIKSSVFPTIDPKLSSLYNGFTVGLNYYHSPKQFVNLSSGYVGDYIDKTFVQNIGNILRSLSIDLSNNHRIGRFEVGYGLSMSANAMCRQVANNTFERYTAYYLNYGLVLPLKYSISENIALGVTYHPLIYLNTIHAWDNTSVTKYYYEHLLSLNLTYKIIINKKHNIQII